MKRRKFLISGMNILAAGASGCVGLGEFIVPNWSEVTPAEMAYFQTRLDGAMNRIAQHPGNQDLLKTFRQQPFGEEKTRLFRQTMRSLMFIGNFGDLSLEGQVHPGVQKRFQYSAPEMNSAMMGLVDWMASLSPTARADIKLALRQDPDLADRVLEAIDIESRSVGTPLRRRLQLRVMGKHIVKRLKHSSDMLIDEYVSKCKKVASQSGSIREIQRLMALRLGKKAFKARLKRAENAARRWQTMKLNEVPIGYQLLQDEKTSKVDEKEEKSDRWYRAGLRILGVGAVITSVGLLILGVSDNPGLNEEVGIGTGVGLVLGVTVGPLTMLVGIMTLMIGGLIDIGDGP